MSLKVKEWKGHAARKKGLSESVVLLGATQNELSRKKSVKKSVSLVLMSLFVFGLFNDDVTSPNYISSSLGETC
jgi:hypothetical protein